LEEGGVYCKLLIEIDEVVNEEYKFPPFSFFFFHETFGGRGYADEYNQIIQKHIIVLLSLSRL
jgi:hypothetical protein